MLRGGLGRVEMWYVRGGGVYVRVCEGVRVCELGDRQHTRIH